MAKELHTSALRTDPSTIGNALKKRTRISELLVQSFLFICAAVSILTTIGIVYELGKESMNFFLKTQWEEINKTLEEPVMGDSSMMTTGTSGSAVFEGDLIRVDREQMRVLSVSGLEVEIERGVNGTAIEPHSVGRVIYLARDVSVVEFLTGTQWTPQVGAFGIWPLLNATLMTTFFAMLIALPLGLGVAVYLSEYATDRVRTTIKPIMEVLAGVPTVVYGYFALTFMTPLLRLIFGETTVSIFNTASAGLVIGILVIPLVSSMSEDALSAVPRSLREASYALGATRLETALQVVVPAAFSGIAAAFIVALSRAIGETMIVAIAAGAGPAFTFNPFQSAETMTGHIVRISGGDLSYDSIDYNSLFALGLVLFFFTLSLNVVSQRIVRRFREVYE
ncbi:MAG TPA: phosphate ABC transporter permease subunit PstC [Anaerolineales bacterium]|nr:phosphate ABC transporter permease subunit PstC [Anaerolineales bacterium]